jgi:hypothetical protein
LEAVNAIFGGETIFIGLIEPEVIGGIPAAGFCGYAAESVAVR